MFWRLAFVAVLAVGVLGDDILNEDQLKQMNDVITLVCKKNNAEDKAPQVTNVLKSFVECSKGLFNIETIKQEIEAAKPNGALDEVFKKYCAKSPELKTCLHALTAGITPCVPTEISKHIHVIDNTTDSLIDFACYKDGDRIALFIAEDGPKCFQEKTNAIRDCTTNIKESLVQGSQNLTQLTLNERCEKFDQLSACVVTALEGCDTPTPANMAEALLKYVRKATPCNVIKKH